MCADVSIEAFNADDVAAAFNISHMLGHSATAKDVIFSCLIDQLLICHPSRASREVFTRAVQYHLPLSSCKQSLCLTPHANIREVA